MAPDRLRTPLQALPFVPFSVELASGKQVLVRHPDFAHLSPAGRTLVVYGDDDDWMEMIDVLLITSLVFGSKGATRPPRRRASRK